MSTRHRTNRILVVDDSPLVAKIVAGMLVRLGYGTVLVSGGLEAVGRVAEEHLDAVISDVQMPGMNGFELLYEIHVRHPRLPVILMSVFADQQMRETALYWGAAELLHKPFGPEELESALKSAWGMPSPATGAHAISTAAWDFA